MSKSDSDLSEIDTSRVTTKTRSINLKEPSRINAFDTETADGRIFLVSYDFEGAESGVFGKKDGFVNPSKLWDLLTDYKCRNAQNMWYNLSFDSDVFLSSVLAPDEVTELAVKGSVEARGYEIVYIPGKFLKITDENKHTYTHYDAAQFFYDSLDGAASEWLGENKTAGVNTEKFGKDGMKPNEYIRDNFRDIKIYAEKDAKLTRKLWRKLTSKAVSLDIPISKPISTGYLAQEWMDYHLPHRPGFGPTEMQSLAWDSYAGGRFEVFERGNVGSVIGADINSAYPNVLANLPDPSTLRWERVENPSFQELAGADYGFVNATVTTDRSKRIQPFAMKVDDVVKYPALKQVEINTLLDIFTFAKSNGYLIEDTVNEAWLGYETNGTKRPFGEIPEMYDSRKTAEANGKMKQGLLLKIILNSMYGKFCQTTPKREYLEETKNLKDYEEIVPGISLPASIRETLKDEVIERLEAGPYFNPFMASYITGMTRLQLHKSVEKHDLVEDTIMFATDCIMVQADAFRRSNFDLVDESLPYAKQLGGWDKEYEGHANVIGAGVYEVDMGDKTKTMTRGFREKDLDTISLVKEVKENGGITANTNRPMTLKEAVWHGRPISDVGAFSDSDRKIDPNMDEKRLWPNELSWQGFIDERQVGNPLLIDRSDSNEDSGTESVAISG